MQPAPRGAAVHSGPVHGRAHRLLWQAASSKLQAASRKQQGFELIPSFKRQAASIKRQATNDKVRHRGAWVKFRAALLVGLD